MIAASMLLLLCLTHPDCAGRADYFGLVLNRAARVQGTAHGGQVLAEGLAVDKAVQEWRTLFPQKQRQNSSKMSKYLPGDRSCTADIAYQQVADACDMHEPPQLANTGHQHIHCVGQYTGC
jgi:hypothetical protein